MYYCSCELFFLFVKMASNVITQRSKMHLHLMKFSQNNYYITFKS